jgi:protein SCO1/2
MSVPPPPAAQPSTPGPIRLSPLWLAFAALALALPLGALLARRPAGPALPVLAEVPAFSLSDQDGKPYGLEKLLGKVVIADFIFTNCPVACPRLTAIMKKLQQGLTPQERAGALGLLSISVDPERDTPERLRAYMQTHGADPQSWTFLTGSELEVERAVVRGFRVAMAKVALEATDAGAGQTGAREADAGGANGGGAGADGAPLDPAEEVRAQAFEILHGERFVLLDARGRIRGYYDVGDPQGLARLVSDARRLVGGEP